LAGGCLGVPRGVSLETPSKIPLSGEWMAEKRIGCLVDSLNGSLLRGLIAQNKTKPGVIWNKVTDRLKCHP